MTDCIFCKVSAGSIPSKIVYQDADVIAFHDIMPVAPKHLLVIPRKHVESIAETEPGDDELLGKLMSTARKVAAEQGMAESGYRLVLNTGRDGGQSVFHLHIHILGGRHMGWPPG